MDTTLSKEKINWGIGRSSKVLEKIHEEQINIAIYERDVNHLSDEINKILYNDLNFKATGNINSIIKELNKLKKLYEDGLITKKVLEEKQKEILK